MEVYPSVLVSDLKIVVQFYLPHDNEYTVRSFEPVHTGIITWSFYYRTSITVVNHFCCYPYYYYCEDKEKELNSRTELPTIYEELDHVDTTQGVVDTESNMAYTTAVHAT